MTRGQATFGVALVTVALLSTVVAGCSRADDSLEGTQWRLSEWTLSSLSPSDFTITAAFADGTISGRSGVNTYSGPYETGSGGSFSVGPLASTEIAGPERAMRAEGAYLTLLTQATSYELAEGQLTLFDGVGNESLIYRAASG